MSTFTPEHVRYEIVAQIGDGLTATVYKAVRHDSRGHSRQTVALKILKDETQIPILRREFETLARVRSLRCARVIAWENDRERAALVLEWIEGESLERLMHENLSDDEISEIVYQVDEGLKDLRETGLHHGDLHPNNVIVDCNGSIRLVDFGTAIHEPGVVRGAAAYLSPEIWAGAPTSLASDLYALGLIEFDLRKNGSNRPTRESARTRSESLATDERGLLARDPAQRVAPAPPVGRARAQGLLANRIAKLRTAKESVSATRVFDQRTCTVERELVSVRSLAASLVALVTTLSISVGAEAPLETVNFRSTLEIRSQRWLEIELNGQPAGFAPIRLTGLKPGIHRLKWRSPHGAGESRIKLVSGEISRFSEAELTQLAAKGNR